MKIYIHEKLENGDIVIDGVNLTKDLDKVSDEKLDELQNICETYAMVNMSLSIAQKTMMNSMYGAMANRWYYFASIDAADDITAEGRFYIRSANKIINNYFVNEWHKDTKTHELLRANEILASSFKTNHTVTPLADQDYVMYIDTDSMYVWFEEIFKSIGFDPKHESRFAEFISYLNDIKLRQLFADELGALVNSRHGENFLKFDLENIAETAIFAKKKKYLMSLKQDGDRVFDDASKHIKGKGIELIQSTMHTEVKKMLRFMIVQLFNRTVNKFNYNQYIRYLYKQFLQMPIEHRCCLSGANGYNEYVLDDKESLKFKSGASATLKGMALYNHKLYKNNLMTKYDPLKGGKVSWYYTENGGSFAFHSDNFPTEIAEPINNLRQFSKLVIEPLSRISIFADIDTKNPLADNIKIEL